MPIPEKREDLVAMGYVFDNDSFCRGCGQPIEWWITPNGKKMPMSVVETKDTTKGFFAPSKELIRVPHWSDCPYAARFKREK